VGGQHHAPTALPPGETRYPLYRRLRGPQGRSGRVQKISPPRGFDPRTVQPVVSRYSDWATRPADNINILLYFRNFSTYLNNLNWNSEGKLFPFHAMKAYKGRRGIAPLFVKVGTRMRLGFRFTALLTPETSAGAHRIGSWVGPTAGLDDFREFR
jgi:hypothetical protein